MNRASSLARYNTAKATSQASPSIPSGLGNRTEPQGVGPAHVVQEDVESPIALDGGGDEAFTVVAVGDVARHDEAFAAAGNDALAGGLRPLSLPIHKADSGALAGQNGRDRATAAYPVAFGLGA